MLFASLSHLINNDILQNEKTRLPATFSSLKPDCSSINVAEKSNQPEDWLLHPIGYVFQFDAQKDQKQDYIIDLKTTLNEKDAEILKLQKKIEKLEREKAEIVAEIADFRG